MAFNDAAALIANDTNFRWRVSIAVARIAQNVAAEDPAALSLPPGYKPVGAVDDAARKQLLHEARLTVVYKARYDPEGIGRLFTFALGVDPNSAAMGASSPDGDIEFTVSACWNSFALGGA